MFLANEEALRSLLAKENGIVTIEAAYDGCCDDGMFNSVEFLNEDGKEVLPASAELIGTVENFVGFLLTRKYRGWEIDGGSYGTVMIDAKTLRGRLEHTYRIEESEETEF